MYVGGITMIQILTFNRNVETLKGPNVVINRIHDAQSLDDFEINIINLNDENMWKRQGRTISLIDSINDFKLQENENRYFISTESDV